MLGQRLPLRCHATQNLQCIYASCLKQATRGTRCSGKRSGSWRWPVDSSLPNTAGDRARQPPLTRTQASVVGAAGDDAASDVSKRAAIDSPGIAQFLTALYGFSRPHTMIGTAVSVSSISLLALGSAPLTSGPAIALIQALVSALLMNIAIVGINQLYDIEIDKINKPYLPLASGALTPQQGTTIVIATAAAGTAIGLLAGSPPLLATLLISLFLGVIYSADLPFMRWKRSPLLAAGCILAVRAIIVQMGFYLHMRGAVLAAAAAGSETAVAVAAAAGAVAAGPAGGVARAAAAGSLGAWVLSSLQDAGTQLGLSPAVLFVVSFMVFFSLVIALFKDIPDVAGDSKAGLRTLSVRLGEGAVFKMCVGMLAAAYAWAVGFSLLLAHTPLARGALVAGHAALAGALLARARGVDTRVKQQLVDFYMFVWKLFYAEYLLIPLFGL